MTGRSMCGGLKVVCFAAALIASVAFASDADDGLRLYKQRDYGKALPLLQSAAERGHAEAQAALGAMYFRGDAGRIDARRALYWSEKAAAQGNANAEFNMGVHYITGNGIAADYRLAVVWLRKAAAKGHVMAQQNLAEMYRTGSGTEQDPKQALAMYRKSADAQGALGPGAVGVFGSLVALSEMYEKGEGVEPDYVEAYKFISVAAETKIDFVLQARSELARKMTPGQLEEGERRAAEWMRGHQDNDRAAKTSR